MPRLKADKEPDHEPIVTTGKTPDQFIIDDSDDTYMIGSEVGIHLKMTRGLLYRKYPGLWRRQATPDERKRIETQGVISASSMNNITLVKTKEIEELIECQGLEDKFKTKPTRASRDSVATDYNKIASTQAASRAAEAAEKNSSRTSRALKPPGWIPPSVPATQSHHLDSVPSATPVSRSRFITKRIRSSPIINDIDDVTMHEAAELDENLIPIRLDVDLEGHRLRDTITWNKNEKNLTPEQFSEILVDDLEIPGSFVQVIANVIRAQVDGYEADVKALKEDSDQRVIIKLNIHVGNTSLVDQFEWDVSCPDNSPEEFAKTLCQELGLGGEFVSAICYSIRGQLGWHVKTLAFTEAPLKPLESPLRTGNIDKWAPTIETFTDQEMEKKIRDQDRNARRMRRLANA